MVARSVIISPLRLLPLISEGKCICICLPIRRSKQIASKQIVPSGTVIIQNRANRGPSDLTLFLDLTC